MKSVKKRKTDQLTELPDSVISHIFSMLTLKTLLKTSALSKQWYHEWGFRKDLNFDMHNMFDYKTIPKLPKTLPLLRKVQSQFATKLDAFMLKYHGDKISSIRVNFPLSHDQTDVIERLIHKGVHKGVNRIELLFACEFVDFDDSDTESESDSDSSDDEDTMKPYKFLFPFLSDNDSLTYLHLQNCLIAAPMEYFGMKNLRTLVLHQVPLKQNMLQDLFLNCIHLENFTLNECTLKSDQKIISSTLLHLKIKCGNIWNRRNIDIIASNLSTMEYSSYFRSPNFRPSNYGYSDRLHTVNIKSHMLSKFSCSSSKISKFVDLYELKNVTTMVLEGLNECLQTEVIPHLFSKDLRLEDVTFKNCLFTRDLKIVSPKLRHLGIINCCDKSHYSYKILINIDALNLSSFEYRGSKGTVFVNAPKLLKVFWDGGVRKYYSVYNFVRIARLHHVENLAMTTHHSQIPKLMKHLVQFQNLRQLELFISGKDDPNKDYFWILDIIMASKYLQKLSLTIKNEHKEKSHMIVSDRRRRENARVFHNDLKYVKLHGCVCSANILELASHLLRSANSLKQITFSSRDDFYIGAGRWTEGFNRCCWYDRNLIHEMLKDEVNEECELIIL
ncbi:uncharacterized protein LOC131628533 [Vicia villosa]|uniref:uncharacterized protein LOC131628533 n=1 Tax=Vicia villosa TaxID=3911 RepID=UPI00273C3610|nr:uncharacterized protein LOC131628533 [Vicia villosa]